MGLSNLFGGSRPYLDREGPGATSSQSRQPRTDSPPLKESRIGASSNSVVEGFVAQIVSGLNSFHSNNGPSSGIAYLPRSEVEFPLDGKRHRIVYDEFIEHALVLSRPLQLLWDAQQRINFVASRLNDPFDGDTVLFAHAALEHLPALGEPALDAQVRGYLLQIIQHGGTFDFSTGRLFIPPLKACDFKSILEPHGEVIEKAAQLLRQELGGDAAGKPVFNLNSWCYHLYDPFPQSWLGYMKLNRLEDHSQQKVLLYGHIGRHLSDPGVFKNREQLENAFGQIYKLFGAGVGGELSEDARRRLTLHTSHFIDAQSQALAELYGKDSRARGQLMRLTLTFLTKPRPDGELPRPDMEHAQFHHYCEEFSHELFTAQAAILAAADSLDGSQGNEQNALRDLAAWCSTPSRWLTDSPGVELNIEGAKRVSVHIGMKPAASLFRFGKGPETAKANFFMTVTFHDSAVARVAGDGVIPIIVRPRLG